MNKLRVFTSFSEYDSQCMAIDRLGIDYELVGWSEIDKYAIQAHNAVYPQWSDRNYGDICKIDWKDVPDFDLFTYSSPCQDFSAAGLQRGGQKGSGTRSSLLWECERAIEAKRPKYLLMENVAALVSSKFIKLFNKWQHTLEGYGYTNYAKVLNAKDYGVPQNRERIFMVSVRDDLNQKFYFPQPFKLEKRLKDMLEDNVDDKYFIKGGRLSWLNNFGKIKEKDGYVSFNPEKAKCLTVRSEPSWNCTYIITKNQKELPESICPDNQLLLEQGSVRKLTPIECERLQTVPDNYTNYVSDTQRYKMLGNGWTVDVITHILQGVKHN